MPNSKQCYGEKERADGRCLAGHGRERVLGRVANVEPHRGDDAVWGCGGMRGSTMGEPGGSPASRNGRKRTGDARGVREHGEVAGMEFQG